MRALDAAEVEYAVHMYRYQEKGGTRASSAALGVDEHMVVKTLVMERDDGQPLIVLMHGDKKVSTKALARAIGAKKVSPCSPASAQRYSGYQVGGTSPFGTRQAMPVYVQETILELPRIFINGGGRGTLVELSTAQIADVIEVVAVDVAIDG